MDSNDNISKITGILKGIKIWMDQNKIVCGLGFVYLENQVVGNKSSNQLSWQLQSNDKISKIQANFT